MKCPLCGASSNHIRVVDTREVSDGIRRRRECEGCNQRFTTYEHPVTLILMVAKRDGRREEFSREKLTKSLRLACTKRPISDYVLEETVQEIETALHAMTRNEVQSQKIGEMVMARLREVDDVAYVRYASVYRRFHDVDSMAAEIEHLQQLKRREQELRNQIPLPLNIEW
jgi:transcriptional repressor NrdR